MINVSSDSELKPMEYWSMEKYQRDYDKRERLLLGHGEYNGYEWLIVSYCSHPCAYIVIDEHTYGYKKNDFECGMLDVHGGVTYSNWGLHEWVDQNEWVIGWDYNHLGDYSPISGLQGGGRKYSTVEIYEDVKDAINQLRDMP